ncbi:putative rubber elongation factor [Helianthus annuus]|nr:putative rubber elongation factor [Helianthus annuus]KAJ0900030.1 putative rubber elongation factor [Helianthus annuus]
MIPVIAQLWYELMNKYPTLAQLSEFILPVVEVMCELYNKAVAFMDGKGYSIAGYLPLVPIDEMKAAYKLVKTSKDGLAAVGDLVGVDANKGLSAVGDILGVNK